MKTMMRLILTLCLFSLLGMFNAAFAAQVYVMGSPTVLPENNKKLPVTIRIEDRPTYGYVLIELEKTSNMPSNMHGICTNAPLNSTDISADLQLLKSDNIGDEWSDLGTGVLKYKMPDSYTGTICEFTVNVRSWDYGAWGKLKATVYKRTGTDANGNDVYKKAGSGIGTVPRDENNNHIADGWNNDFYPYEWKSGSSDAIPKEVDKGKTKKSGVKNYPYSKPLLGKRQNTVDKETGPTGNGENGDGFTVFEEYRGFMTTQRATGNGYTAAGHIRTSPETKDVFYVIHSSMSAYGSGTASKHPTILFTEMHQRCVNDRFVEVWNSDRTAVITTPVTVGWINTNSDNIPDWEHVHALRIRAPIDPNTNRSEHPINPNTYGNAQVYKPDQQSVANIFLDTITAHVQQNRLVDQNGVAFTLTEVVNHVIAHEIGHMVNLAHCSTACLTNYPATAAKPNNGCMMDPYTSEYSVRYSPTVEHYADYDLAGDRKGPEAADGAGRTEAPPDNGTPAEPTRSLTSSNGSDTAEAGDSHTVNYTISTPYSSVYWYVKSPSDTSSLGTNVEIDQGNGSLTTASMTYTFPSGTSGFYKITSYVYVGSATYEDSYTVTVTLPATVTHACGVHSGPASDANAHSLQASCPVTNANGDSCTVTSFYACQSHTHQYPAPTISCGRSACTETVSSTNEHRVTCANGHPYWNCNPSAVSHHITRTCRFSGCGRTWEKCTTPITPVCNNPWRKRNGLKCWGINE